MEAETLKAQVRERYGAAALAAGRALEQAANVEGETEAQCGCGCGSGPCCESPVSSGLYSSEETGGIPTGAVRASLGCGNPIALAELRRGETVLDLGSGGGLDVLLSARRVGPNGRVFGLDMTDEMLELARTNQRAAGVTNVEFLKGDIEQIPLPDESVDVILSNCVVNLAADKQRVISEAFRVLKPGGRLAISDIVMLGDPGPEVRRSLELWLGCIAGALEVDTFHELLQSAGFVDSDIELTRVYGRDDTQRIFADSGSDQDRLARAAENRFAAGFIRARKP